MSAWRAWLVPAIAAAGFFGIYALDANRSVFLALNALGPATSDALWMNVTLLGDALVAFALCLPLWRRRPDVVWAFVAVALLGTAWARGFKPLVDVARPPAVLGDAVHVIGPLYRMDSFPSGHATAAFAIAGLLVLGLRLRLWSVLALALATLVAISRAVVGVHWPLDILAGAFGGWIAALLGVWIAQRTARVGLHPAVQWAVGLFLAACAAALVAGYPRDYPRAELLERAIGICCLGAAAARLRRAAA